MQYLVKANEPFRGSVESVILPSGIVAYTGGKSLDEYRAGLSYDVRVIDESELDSLIAAFESSRVTEPELIDADKWEYALNVLPPARWQTVRGVNLFHVSEHISGDLVDWYARIDDRFFHFVDRAGRNMIELADKVGAILNTKGVC